MKYQQPAINCLLLNISTVQEINAQKFVNLIYPVMFSQARQFLTKLRFCEIVAKSARNNLAEIN
jgi:hypothetical protein